MDHLLSVIIFFPVFGAGLILLVNKGFVRLFGIVISSLELVFTMLMWALFDNNHPTAQFVSKLPILENFGIYYYVGADGLSLILLILNAFILFVSTVYLDTGDDNRPFFASILCLSGILMGVFASLNILLFYVFWELSLVPVLYIVNVWGTGERVYSALKFFMYTFASSLAMLLSILYYACTYNNTFGVWSFNLDDLYSLKLSVDVQVWLFIGFFVSIAVKIPMVPFHTWLPHVYADAPVVGSVFLSAVLSKMGTYAATRFLLPFFPDASRFFSAPVYFLSIIMVVYCGILALRRKDLKQVVGYSSISHMGVIVLGIFSLNVEGVTGSVFMMASHGIVSCGLFMLLGMLCDRGGGRAIEGYGGLAKVMPNYSCLFMLVMLSNIGLPLTSGFVGEFLSLLGFFKNSPVVAAFASTTLVLSAVYMLSMFKNIFFGVFSARDGFLSKDLSSREYAVLLPIVFVVVLLGLFPNILLGTLTSSTTNLLNLVGDRSVAMVPNSYLQGYFQAVKYDPESTFSRF